MISRLDLDQRVREWGLSEEVVEKDYVIGWVLWGIGSHETREVPGAHLRSCGGRTEVKPLG